jgi:uncharacterized membrane protein (DUF106 family)
MAVAYTAVSIAAQRLLSNPKRMREIQAKVQIMQKEMTSMMKNNASQDELMAKQREFMPLMGEQMKNSMKPMLVVLPLLLITYYLIIPNLPFPSAYINGTKEFFFIIVFGIGMVAAVFILLYDRKKSKEEMKAMLGSDDNSKESNARHMQQNNQ